MYSMGLINLPWYRDREILLITEEDFDPWAQLSVEAETRKLGLDFHTIEGVEPLDAQFGVDAPKTVPHELYDMLFGKPEPTELELARGGGNPAKVQPLHTYAILDAAKVKYLSELLSTSGLEYRCLFKGAAFDELKDVAPWIVRLKDGNSFTRKLFTRSDAPWHLWDKEVGIYLRSESDLEELSAHFRKFTRLNDPVSGGFRYFRYYDPAILRTVVKNLPLDVFGDFSRNIQLFACQDRERFFVLQGVGTDEKTDPKSAPLNLRLDRFITIHTMAAFSAERHLKYVRTAVSFLSRRFAPAVRTLDWQNMSGIVELAYHNARARGIRTEDQHLKYLIPVMFWGSHFEADPQYHEALQAAGWLDLDGRPTSHRYVDPVIEQIDAWHPFASQDTEEPRTLVRLLSQLRLDFVKGMTLEEVTFRIAEIWPKRSALRLEKHRRTAVTTALRDANVHGLLPADAALCAGVVPFFGQGFLHDPRFPWASAAAAQPEAFLEFLEEGLLKYWKGLIGLNGAT